MNTASANSAGEKELDSFDADCRCQALAQLAAHAGAPSPVNARVNMHIHSFFSFNTHGYSPAHIAWQARQAGLYAAGLCDFDVLDGLEEFLQAGLTLGLRAAVNLETRAYLKAYANVDINSPGEPGVTYIMGAGFPRLPAADTPASLMLNRLRQQADKRNRDLAQRINARLPELALDYEQNVVSLSPGGCPTERHLVRAYRLQAEAVFYPGLHSDSGATGSRQRLGAFWAKVMNRPLPAVEKLTTQTPALEDAIRSALVKRGGIGYEPPTEKTFPLADEFIAWVLACDAIPMVTWLDGTSAGEQDMHAMLTRLQAMGACALNIIPDRNHNIADPSVRTIKLKKLTEAIHIAEQLEMPVNIGTEMNKQGQPFADDIACAALRPYQAIFLRGARIMIGQCLLARYAGFAYAGAAARAEFGHDLRHKNEFFEAAGSLPPLTTTPAERLAAMGRDKAFNTLRDSAGQKQWTIR